MPKPKKPKFEKIEQPKSMPKEILDRQNEYVTMTVEQLQLQMAFFAKNWIALGKILNSSQTFIYELHHFLIKMEKKPSYANNKYTKKMIKDIRKIMKDSGVFILKKQPKMPAGLPNIPLRNIAPTGMPPNPAPNLIGKAGMRAKATQNKAVQEIVRKIHNGKGVKKDDKKEGS